MQKVNISRFSVFIVLSIGISSCGKTPDLPLVSAADSLAIVDDNIEHRAEADRFFRSDEGSPFVRDTTIAYHGLNWYPINPRYRGYSVLHRYQHADTVIVLGTKGEERKQLRYGYFEFVVPDEKDAPTTIRLNVYKFTPYDVKRYALYKDNLSVWFTDLTTGKETYDVGRYVEIGSENPDADHVYTIELNKAYNPYCAYSDLYSCAVPRKEDHLAIALRVGEMRYHE